MWKRRWIGLLKTVCALLLLGWAFNQVGTESWSTLLSHRLQLGWVMAGIGFGFLSVLGWAGRWYLLLRGIGIPVPFREIWRLTMIADFFNLYFLGPIGADGVRYAFLHRQAPNKRVELASTLVLDHIMGLQALVVAFVVFTFPHWSWIRGQSENNIGLAGTIAATTILLFGAASGGVFWPIGRRIMNAALGWFKNRPTAKKGQELLTQIGDMSYSLWGALLVAAVSQASAYGAFWCAANAIQANISTPHLLAILPIIDAFATLPITISGLGIREQFFLAAFGHGHGHGADGALAVASSLLGFFFLGIWGMIGGIMLFLTKRAHPGRDLNRSGPRSELGL
jgi:uncharacterized membrane protein YbhN (UPF0104 family)